MEDGRPIKKRRLDDADGTEVKERVFNVGTGKKHNLPPETLPDDAFVLTALIDFAAETMAGNQFTLPRASAEQFIDTRFRYHVEVVTPTEENPRLYYTVTFSFPPYIFVRLGDMQRLMGMSTNYIHNMVTRTCVDTGCLELQFQFYSRSMPAPKTTKRIEFVTIQSELAPSAEDTLRRIPPQPSGFFSMLRNPFSH